MKINSIGIIGGDLRQECLAKMMRDLGYNVYFAGFSEDFEQDRNLVKMTDIRKDIKKCQLVILPLPVANDFEYIFTPLSNEKIKIEEILYNVEKGTLLLGGKISSDLIAEATERMLYIEDYIERDDLSVLNAVPTAEGALQIAMEEMLITLNGCNALITGHGRIAKVLIKLLMSFGANVTVAARKYGDLAWAKVEGCKGIHISQLEKNISDIDVIFNTVPSKIFDKNVLTMLKPECLLIDLASKPGGVDFTCAKDLGIKTIWALSLPGRVAPITSAKIIRDTILNIMSERGYSQ